MGPEFTLGLGLVILAAFWFLAWRYERRAGEEADVLIGQVDRALSGFQVRVEHDASGIRKRREREGPPRRRRGRRKPGSG